MIRVRASGLSDVGRTRAHNEDAFGIHPEIRTYVVADGMGGHTHGEVASRIAVEAIFEFVRRARGRGGRRERGEEILAGAVKAAQEEVLEAIGRDARLVGMGTTVVGLLLTDHRGWVAHVGDSRAYRLRGGQLERLTEDHTWVHEQLTAGRLTAEEIRSHPFKSVVTRALGGESKVDVDIQAIDPQPGDLYLLCSDGLSSMLGDEEIREHLTARGSLQEICLGLVNAANAHGGVDNITVVLVALSAEADDAGE